MQIFFHHGDIAVQCLQLNITILAGTGSNDTEASRIIQFTAGNDNSFFEIRHGILCTHFLIQLDDIDGFLFRMIFGYFICQLTVLRIEADLYDTALCDAVQTDERRILFPHLPDPLRLPLHR